jgi:solute carrier family 25 folate transporter 32
MQLQNRKSMEKIVDLRGKPIVPYRNSFDAVRNIVRDEGMTSLYIGIAPSLLLISHGMINFVCYDKLKSAYLKQFEKDRLNAAESFVIGGVTKMVAAVSTYPLQVVKTRLQDQRNRYDTVRYTGMYDAMVKMYRYEGYRTFFRGIVPHVIRTSPSAAITFMLYEEIMAIMNKMV